MFLLLNSSSCSINFFIPYLHCLWLPPNSSNFLRTFIFLHVFFAFFFLSYDFLEGLRFNSTVLFPLSFDSIRFWISMELHSIYLSSRSKVLSQPLVFLQYSFHKVESHLRSSYSRRYSLFLSLYILDSNPLRQDDVYPVRSRPPARFILQTLLSYCTCEQAPSDFCHYKAGKVQPCVLS